MRNQHFSLNQTSRRKEGQSENSIYSWMCYFLMTFPFHASKMIILKVWEGQNNQKQEQFTQKIEMRNQHFSLNQDSQRKGGQSPNYIYSWMCYFMMTFPFHASKMIMFKVWEGQNNQKQEQFTQKIEMRKYHFSLYGHT